MRLCKPFYSKHNWKRYDDLVEQLFTGGYMAWHKCDKCEKIKFDWADRHTPAYSDIEQRKERIKNIMKRVL
jgi:hypothetical protein